jgi:hypothetical protein
MTSIGSTVRWFAWRISTSQEKGLLVPKRFFISNVNCRTFLINKSWTWGEENNYNGTHAYVLSIGLQVCIEGPTN